MVYEFPELQGAMGRYYALDQGEDTAVADAIKDHYKPQGPSDEVPIAPVSAAVALADKLDTLVGFWAIDEKPTGSKDPFALRRAALGVIRILLEGGARFGLVRPLHKADFFLAEFANAGKGLKGGGFDDYGADLLAFFADRLKVHLRDEGIRHDVIDAVFALGDDDLVRVTAKARALQAFLDTEDGAALLAGFNRAANILKAEEKKDGESYDADPDADYLAEAPEAAERALIAALAKSGPEAENALKSEDFTAAMGALAQMRAPIDAFFESVTVNTELVRLRRNRLLLLSRIRAAVGAVADFAKITG